MTSYADELLSNPKADRVKTVARLATRQGRKSTGNFLVEGPQAVREALKASQHNPSLVTQVYAAEGFLDANPEFVELLSGTRVFTRTVTGQVLLAMADTMTPQGIIAVARITEPTLEEIFAQQPKLIAVLCQVQDPGNAGTILRAADAAGADAVVLTKGSVDIYNPKAVRSTVGSLFHLPVLSAVDFAELAQLARANGVQLLAADGYGAHDLDALQDASVLRRHDSGAGATQNEPALEQPSAWLFGNEGQGLNDEEKHASDYGVAVPLYGAAESLNVGTAATVCLYASARAQSRMGAGA